MTYCHNYHKKISIIKFYNINITIISTNAYCTTCHLKKDQVFVILIKDIKFQAKKETKTETNLENIVLEKYHKFFDILSKKKLDTFAPY